MSSLLEEDKNISISYSIHKTKLQTDQSSKRKEKKRKKPHKLLEEDTGKFFFSPSTGFPYF